ncbi:MAG: tyrosine-type recombinase/integrase [Lachnospiraceae bacterium]|nr:tyrosine-type recombinase/integrase [Lachnospiraceae bacterium]
MKHIITEQILDEYKKYLIKEEKSNATISKYIRDIKKLMDYAAGKEITKELMAMYKKDLYINKKYELSSINSFITAANGLFVYLEWYGLRIKTYHIQKEVFLPENRDLSKKEYKKLVNSALHNGKKRLAMIIKTLCATGIRVSELSYITMENIKKGMIDIYCKGKQRKALIPGKLKKLLLRYASENGIEKGVLFCTSSGKAVDRSNVWKEMKKLSEKSGVIKKKIFPHNLRHLFAKTFYEINKDIVMLAGLLGHSSVETTRIYTMTSYGEYMKQLNQMELV